MKPFIFLLAMLAAGCTGSHKVSSTAQSSSLIADGKIWSSLFQQKAAEYEALCIQAFNIARLRVESWPSAGVKPYAIITDIDETFLDNSPYAVKQAMAGKDYDPSTWSQWTSLGIADTLSGALAFFRYAATRAEIFYVTNRDETEREGTLKNIQHFGLPFADNSHLIMRQQTSSKEDRRQDIAKTHDIMMLMGDNLADFSSLFDKKSTDERSAAVQALANQFGNRFIILPNANYGGWEDAIYLNQRQWSTHQKDSLIRQAVKGY